MLAERTNWALRLARRSLVRNRPIALLRLLAAHHSLGRPRVSCSVSRSWSLLLLRIKSRITNRSERSRESRFERAKCAPRHRHQMGFALARNLQHTHRVECTARREQPANLSLARRRHSYARNSKTGQIESISLSLNFVPKSWPSSRKTIQLNANERKPPKVPRFSSSISALRVSAARRPPPLQHNLGACFCRGPCWRLCMPL
jgi:hypothetical protein